MARLDGTAFGSDIAGSLSGGAGWLARSHLRAPTALRSQGAAGAARQFQHPGQGRRSAGARAGGCGLLLAGGSGRRAGLSCARSAPELHSRGVKHPPLKPKTVGLSHASRNRQPSGCASGCAAAPPGPQLPGCCSLHGWGFGGTSGTLTARVGSLMCC